MVPPILRNRLPQYELTSRPYYRFLVGFAGGIVLAVAFCHSLPDAFGEWAEFSIAFGGEDPSGVYAYPWPSVIALFGVLLTFAIEEVLVSLVGGGHHHHHHQHDVSAGGSEKDGLLDKPQQYQSIEEPAVHERSGSAISAADRPDRDVCSTRRHLMTEMWILWTGLSFHSFFVGVALGITGSEYALFSAIVAHQFFEGLALGSRVARLELSSSWHIWAIDIAFALTAPLGIAVGLVIRATQGATGDAYTIIEMVVQALSGGILVYVALVHMIKEEMDHVNQHARSFDKAVVLSGVILGGASMAILAIWA